MIVFGDAPRPADPRAEAEAIAAGLDALADAPASLERHGRLVGLLIAAGALAQGLADAEFADVGDDRPSPERAQATALAFALAQASARSWSGGFARSPTEAAARAQALALAAVAPRGPISLKAPEGFAHYALYPEAYGAAAAPFAGVPATVVGLRSIGLTLGAVVAAALGAPPPVSVRPVGHPFARKLALGPELRALFARRDRAFALVDEGPGLSGSSLAAAVEAVEASGPARLALYPGHAGEPGVEASEAARAVWRRIPRRVASFESVILEPPGPRRLDRWFADLVGPAVRPLEDLSGGAWRARRFGDDPARWPPAAPGQERRKFLLTSAQGRFLLKFVGLGAIGEGKAARARTLAEAGFVEPPLAFRHGFLLERWRDDLRPWRAPQTDAATLARVGAYLAFRRRAFRRRAFPAPAWSGAAMQDLFAMTRANAAEVLGEAAGAALERWRPALPTLAAKTVRIRTDNRLHAWEWLGDGARALKTDALDHCESHDLVGCQDVAWDVAGAVCEWALERADRARLLAAIEADGGAVDAGLLAFFALAYPAFQAGLWRMAGEAAQAARYERALRAALA